MADPDKSLKPPANSVTLVDTRNWTMKIVGGLWLLLSLALLANGFHQAIYVAPTEATMGEVQRIFYYHVPSAIMGLIFPYVNLAGSLAYLYFRRSNPMKAQAADALALAAAEVTLVFTTIGLVTGSLWARPAWGIWWAWDERMTTYLLLWLLYVSYMLLRRFSASSGAGGALNGSQTHTLAAVLSIFAGIDVPIVYMSIRWWRTQHPSPVFFGGADSGLDPRMNTAFLWNIAAWFCWAVFLLGLRYSLERGRQCVERDAALRELESSLQTSN